MTEFAKTPLGSELAAAVASPDDSLTALRTEEGLGYIHSNHVSESIVRQAVIELQNAWNWDGVVRLVEALIGRDREVGAQIVRRYSQALIELGGLSGASCLLRIMTNADLGDQHDEVLELQGRIAKQRNVGS